jgi:hypothetical protein
MKAVQVIATYFGERRNYPSNILQVTEVLNQQIGFLQDFDVGCDCDLLIVNHDTKNPQVHDYLSSLSGIKTKNGIVRILHRSIISNDLSFGSYKYAFYKLENEYDYWYFTEDDILPLKENYIKEMINIIEGDPLIGFVAALTFNKVHNFSFDEDGYIKTVGTSWSHPPHAHGGVGLTTTKILQNLRTKLPSYFNTPNINNSINNTTLKGGYAGDNIEIEFTNAFTQIGYKLKAYSPGTYFKRLQDGQLL